MMRLFKIGALCALAWSVLPASAMPLGYRLSRQARAAVRQAAEVPAQDVWKVAFDAQGGSLGTTRPTIVTNGCAVGKLPTATRESYDFVGWFTAAEGGEAVTAETVVTTDVTYYAHWTEIVVNYGGEMEDVSFSKAKTETGALYDAKGNCVGTVELKFGKKGKKGVKLSASATMIIGGKSKKISAKAVTLADGETRKTLTFKDPIGELAFEMGADGVFTLKNAKYEMVGLKEIGGTVQEVKVGGNLPNGTLHFNLGDGSMPNFGKDGTLLKEALPDGEPVHVKGGKWSCDKAASLKYKKDKKTGVYALDGMNDPKKPNKSGLKLSYTAKTGVFKGSFKMYARTEGAKTKLKTYTVNVSGVVVDGVGYGTATCKKPAVSWAVTVR